MPLQMPNNGLLTGTAVLLNSNNVWLFNLSGKFKLPSLSQIILFIMIIVNEYKTDLNLPYHSSQE